jgi:hypothetical protein
MESRQPVAFHHCLDDAASRLVAQAMIDHDKEPIAHLSTTSLINSKTEKQYRRIIAAWAEWAGFAEEKLLELDHDDLCVLVEKYVLHKSTSVAQATLKEIHSKAIPWWASHNNIEPPVTDRTKKIKAKAKGRGKAKSPSKKQLTDLILGCKTRSIAVNQPNFYNKDPDVLVGWHLRQRAAYLLAITTSIRIESELHQFADEHVLIDRDAEGKFVRVPKTKTGLVRDIFVKPRQRIDEICPLAALERWYEWCAEHSLERPDGLWLPHVNLRADLDDCLHTGGAESEKHVWKRYMRPYLIGLGHNIDGVSLHGLRSMAIEEAVNQGWDDTRLRDLGGWKSLKVAAQYASGRGAVIELEGGADS